MSFLNNLHLALFQHIPARWGLEENFAVFLEAVEAASRAGAQLLAAPECFLDGYAAADPGSSRERLREAAQAVGESGYLARIGEEAGRRRMAVVFRFVQRDGDRLYNAAGLWGRDGRLAGVYHKTHLQEHDRQFDPGQSLPVFETEWGPVGLMICADRRWPETARAMRLQGARLIVCPSYGMSHKANEWWMRTRAYENDCFVAFAHPRVGFVARPDGELAGKLEDRDRGLLSLSLDLSHADRHNHLGDRRPELYGAICR
ncbi:MAG: carbon-nitrogen hydrolase family protein [Armatimonadetes bacterium]|nr:carbon-nitrogen hydrolase family protein [Armatimonadota bacterium]